MLFVWDGVARRAVSAGSIADAEAQIPASSWRWVHLDGNREATARWVREQAGLDTEAAEILLAQTTRPRCETDATRVLLVGRGVNLNPDSKPEDMVSVRFWATRDRLVTVILRPVRACAEVAEHLNSGGNTASGPSDLLLAILKRLVDRMSPAVEAIRIDLDDISERIIDESIEVTTAELVPIRSQAIGFHRYITPLIEEIRELSEAETAWVDDRFRTACREYADRLIRIAEDLAAIQARAAVARDEIVSQSTEKLNRRVYTLTVLAAVSLPLTVLTGALGMNVGGLPGASSPSGFVVTLGVLVLFVALEILILRRFRWL